MRLPTLAERQRRLHAATGATTGAITALAAGALNLGGPAVPATGSKVALVLVASAVGWVFGYSR